MHTTELQTARTILRPFTEEDAIQTFSWFGDPEVMKFTPHGPDITMESNILRITNYIEHQNKYGYAKWIILDRYTLQPIGDSGPMYFPECHAFELGFRLLPSFWNQGIATEVTSAWLRYCRQILDLKNLMAFAHTGNLASMRVLEKTGFQFSHQKRLMGMDSMVFSFRKF
jgi:RimJ/RimL family protein N-acetyltransferase